MLTYPAASAKDIGDRPVLHIRLLGEFGLTYDGEVVHAISSPRLQSLLALLVLHRGTPQSRRHLAFTLWPDSSESQAQTNLRRELHNLRQALPAADQFLSAGRQTLLWRPDAPFTLDVAAFEQAVAAAGDARQAGDEPGGREALVAAGAFYKGELLPGCYDDWLLAERERLHQAYLQVLHGLVVLLQAQGDHRPAIDYAQQLLREDPLAEEAYLHLIRLYAAAGERARALRIYHSCVTTLQRELGVEPGAATRQAYEQVLRTETPQPSRPVLPIPFASGSPLVGRQGEWQSLLSCWQAAQHGAPQFVAVTGDVGIGKTRLLEELLDWASRHGTTTAQARCYASEGGLAYAPVADWLRAPGLHAELPRLEKVWLSQVARLLPELLAEQPALPAPEPITEGWQRQQFYQALARAISAAGRPLILVIDDLQWADQETLAWLRYLLRSAPGAPLLLAAAVRFTGTGASQSLAAWLADLRRTDQVTEIELGPLDEAETASLAAHVAGGELDASLSAHLYAETEGNALFIVETIRAREQTSSRAQGTALSPRIQSVIEARLAQLSYPARRIANLAAAIGRSFAFDVLEAASEEDEDWLVQALDELWQQRIIREQSDQDYDFSHNKIREVVYNSLSAANRRLLHRRIAGAMEIVYAANLDAISKELALQVEAAGSREKAVDYFLRAGQLAQQIYANAEAIQLYTRALSLLETLPETPERSAQELSLQRQLSIAYRNTKGYAAAEVGQALSRARALCAQLGQAEALPPIMWGLFTFHFVRSDLREAYRLGEELFSLAQANPSLLQQAHFALGGSLSSLGELAESVSHFDRQIALYDPSHHREQIALFGVDHGIFCRAWSAHPLWLLGHPDQARQRSEDALALARTTGHPFSQGLALAYATMLFQFNHDSERAQESAEATITYCNEHSIGYYDHWATILHGWALAERGSAAAGIAQIHTGLDRLRASRSEARLPYYLTLLAEACVRAGQVEVARRHLDEALAVAARNEDVWYSAETHRLQAELLLRAGEVEQAARSLQASLDLSRRQGARSLELRAAVSLAQLWLGQGRPEAARSLLAGVYSTFSEGLDTSDLQAARKILHELS